VHRDAENGQCHQGENDEGDDREHEDCFHSLLPC
jgi:hypothetical protein